MSDIAVHQRLASARLEALRNQKAGAEKEHKKQETMDKLKLAITNAFFLENKRKELWLAGMDVLTMEEAENLLGAILRENMRWKKGTRKIKFKPIPEKATQGTE